MVFLNKIVDAKKEEIGRRKAELLSIRREVSERNKKNGKFCQALKNPGLSIIAEFKRRSPSAGIITESKDPGIQAELFQQGGAEAVSVLTDREFFGGSVEDFVQVKKHVLIPVLRKDFIVDPLQIYQSAFLNADAVLLIVRILGFEMLKDFICLAGQLGMDSLVEVHNLAELETALKAEAEIVGINNRDLDTFNVSTETSLALKKYIPETVLSVSESGVASREQMQDIEIIGFDGVLIGSLLMRSENPAGLIKHLLEGAR